MRRFPQIRFRSQLIAMFLSLFLVTWAGVAITAHQTVSRSVLRVVSDHKLWLAIYSESFLLDLQAGNTISVERKLNLLVNRKIYSSVSVNFGSNVISATTHEPAEANVSRWYEKWLPVNTISTELRDVSNSKWGTLTAAIDEGYLYSPIYDSIDTFFRFSFGLFIIYLGICLLMAMSFEGPVTALGHYFDLFLSVDPKQHEKLSFLLNQKYESSIVELNSLSDKFKNVIRKLIDLHIKTMDFERVAAVAQTTQMLAHDVRKPFSLLRMALGMLAQAKDPAAIKLLMSRIAPEIDKAISSVDGMISDVMEIGSASTTLFQEAASPESLIEATLGDLIRIHPKAVISFDYDLKHKHMANVQVQKIGRVFSNIVGNAFQAIRIKGSMWFKTSERDGMIQFCVGNAGSVIPEESLSKLFDAFFTSGKKGGTGLGLAIAQKVVMAHGGTIWCESSKTAQHPEGKVEFFFTLPIAAKKLNETTAVLPKNSIDIAANLVFLADNLQQSLSVDKGELTLESDIVHALAVTSRTLSILIVDDEAIYRSGLSYFLTRTDLLADHLTITHAENSEDALKALSTQNYDLVITDVDMGSSSLSGFELVDELRARGSTALVCVHSNRIVAADSKTAIDSGANYFMPKPMARAQLLRILLQAASPQATPTLRQGTQPSIVVKPEVLSRKPVVLVIDDSPMTLFVWEEMLAPDAVVHTMKSFEDLTEKIASDPNFIGELTYVITDMHLDGSAGDGMDVGRLIKGLRPNLTVLMSSNETFEIHELVGVADNIIPKEPVDLAELRVRSVLVHK